MALIRGISGEAPVALERDWRLLVTAAGAAAEAAEAERLGPWIAAPVPGTAEQALRDHGMALSDGESLHDRDVWYATTFTTDGPGILRLQGLAGPAEITLDAAAPVASASMYLAHEIPVPAAGRHRLILKFPALTPLLATAKGPRARWRPMMITPGTLRLVRTTALGHMPGWSPPVAVVGPWKPVEFVPQTAPFRLSRVVLTPRLVDGHGILDAELEFAVPPDGPVELVCDGHAQVLHRSGTGFAGRLTLDSVRVWWPHTHGEPVLHQAMLHIGVHRVDLGRVGFRSLALDRGEDGKGFALIVNGERLFCRGAAWMPPDPAGPATADPLPLLTLARDAGMTMIRVSGTTAPEAQRFHDACDALGLLVWQDLPFANFDYPAADPAFAALVEEETRQLLSRLQASPSLAVVCGGSELAQQATMLGLTPDQARMPLFEERFATLAADHAPGAVYVPHTPWGEPLPFVTDEGVTHYFGVGAYCRPLADARSARVRFASECLAFANVPSPARLRADGLSDPTTSAWKRGVPRDAGASWDFEDVRDHYVGALYGVDAAHLRTHDPERYLALGRAAPAELMEAVFAEWRRGGSPTAGGLVWVFNDMMAGAGWGVLDHRGEPKTTYHALKRAFRPLHVGITDEGLNGLGLHVVNETDRPRDVILTLAAYGEGAHPVARAEAPLSMDARGTFSTTSHALLGRFFDITHAYRFGPLAHEVTLVRLLDAGTRAILAEASHAIAGRAAEPRAIGLSVLVEDETLVISTERLARFVTIDDDGFRADDEGFCLAPGETRRVRLIRRSGSEWPKGLVAALNSVPVAYGSAS